LPRRKHIEKYLCAFVKYDIKDIEVLQIPSIEQNYLEENWEYLCSELQNQIFCLFLQSAHKGNQKEAVFFDEKALQLFLGEKSQRTVVGLSLISHCCRLKTWDILKEFLPDIHSLKLAHIDTYWKKWIDESCRVLSDRRVIHLISCITGLKFQDLEIILKLKEFQIHLVDFDAPIKGWVTPIGIAINISALNNLEKTNIIASARIFGHELTHYLSRLSSRNFSISTPERIQKSLHLQQMISSLKENHHDIENHLESGLLFELGFIGEKFSSSDYNPQRKQWKQLEKNFLSNINEPLPLFKKDKDIPFCHRLAFDEQFGFYYPFELEQDSMLI
jgi:hypothetical protein